MTTDEKWMWRALELAKQAQRKGEVPVGAVLVKSGVEVASGWNRSIRDCDPSAHAEIVTLRAAGAVMGNYRLPGTILYVTVEPCVMCVGAIINARVGRVVYATEEPRTGAAGSVFDIFNSSSVNHRLMVTSGILRSEAKSLMQNFFKSKRAATPRNRYDN